MIINQPKIKKSIIIIYFLLPLHPGSYREISWGSISWIHASFYSDICIKQFIKFTLTCSFNDVSQQTEQTKQNNKLPSYNINICIFSVTCNFFFKRLTTDGILLNNKKEQTITVYSNWMDFKTFHWVKKISLQRLHTAWFHLYDTLEMTELWKWGEES